MMGAMDLQLESAAVQHGQAKLNVEVHAQGSSLSDGNYMAAKINGSNSDDYERLEKGVMQSGCAHYEGDATYKHHAAMRFFIAGTATMKQRLFTTTVHGISPSLEKRTMLLLGRAGSFRPGCTVH